MQTAQMLTDVYGPRLTGSPLTASAGEYVMQRLRDWGVSNVHAEHFDFDRPSWMSTRYHVQVVSPAPFPVVGAAAAWSAGTDSLLTADVVIARVRVAEDTLGLRGTLRGKIVLTSAPFESRELWAPPSAQLTPDLLDQMMQTKQDAYVTRRGLLVEPSVARNEPTPGGTRISSAVAASFLKRQGVLAIIRTHGGSAGVYPVGSAVDRSMVEIHAAAEHYGRMYRTVESGVPVRIEIDIRNTVSSSPARPFNVIADIPGTDLRNEIVIIGAHLDSWVTGTGATDNAAGAAVVLEAMRLLRTAGAIPRRTVRLALWTGEEQAMRGSAAYVREHIARQVGDAPGGNRGSDTFHAYFNLDNGGGVIRAVDTNGREAARPALEAWISSLSQWDLPITHVLSVGNNPSDDAVFIRHGPSFYFHQDPLDYYRGTQHTSQDLYERLVPEYLRTNAVVVAALAYFAANAAPGLLR